MPNRRSNPFRYRPNNNPHNPDERFIRPNGKPFYPRSPMKVVRWQDMIFVFRTHNPETARRLIEITHPGLVLGEPAKDWVKELYQNDPELHVMVFHRGHDGIPVTFFKVESVS